MVAYLFSIFIVASLSLGHFNSPGSTPAFLNEILRGLFLTEANALGAFPANTFPNAVNGSLWTIRYEFGCYIGVMCFGIIGLLRRRIAVLVLFSHY